MLAALGALAVVRQCDPGRLVYTVIADLLLSSYDTSGYDTAVLHVVRV